MTEQEELFHQIANDIADCVEGKMFGAMCLKSSNGKAAAIFWQDDMLFKLNESELQKALELKRAIPGHHLYAPDKRMKGWVRIPSTHSSQWLNFSLKAIEFVNSGIKVG